MKITVKSVAERAEVSVGTVSRVLNDDPNVSPDLSRRVRETIDELGYKPLRKKKTQPESGKGLRGKTIGLLTLGMDRSLSRLPVVTAAIDGIRDATAQEGAFLQIVDLPNPAEVPGWLERARFDGWLVKAAMQGDIWKAAHPAVRCQLESSPCVWFHGHPRGAPGWSVGVNDWDVGTMAAHHLYEKGHLDVAFLSPKTNHKLLKHRQHGFLATCEELGMKCRGSARNLQAWTFPLERPRSLAAVNSLLSDLLKTKTRPTAIFTPADSIATLLYRALAEQRIAIPDDISVISANREEGLIAGLFPALTTIDVRSEEIGMESVKQLRRLFESDNGQARQDLYIEPELVEGESVAQI